MIFVRITAVLVLVALVLAVLYFVTKRQGYLTWAWRVFIAALVAMVGLLGFYFVERLVTL
ncbi:MAG TPA: hypothetical protein VED01_20890 [Burkholderiales bacterium]|nr:hypothetical protein [Burkholderiales bacterium]